MEAARHAGRSGTSGPAGDDDEPDVEAAVPGAAAADEPGGGAWTARLRRMVNSFLFGDGQAGGHDSVDNEDEDGAAAAVRGAAMSTSAQPSYLKRSRTYRRHEGNNNFLLRGHCDTIQGPGTRGIAITFLLIAAPSGVALGLVGNRLIDVSPAFEVVLAIWTAVTLTFFALTAVTCVAAAGPPPPVPRDTGGTRAPRRGRRSTTTSRSADPCCARAPVSARDVAHTRDPSSDPGIIPRHSAPEVLSSDGTPLRIPRTK